MNIDELRSNLTYLIEKYVNDTTEKTYLLNLSNRENVPAKGILANMTPYIVGKITEDDSRLVGDIAFNFC